MQVQSVKRSRLTDEVIAQVRKLVAGGKYRVGDRLPAEGELCELFGVGRSTIREAMRVLSNRGLVDVRHGEGTYVTSRTMRASLEERLERAVLTDIYEARLYLELALSGLAAQRRDAKDVAAMRKCLTKRAAAARAGDVPAYADADFGFHLAVAKAAKSPALYDVYESFVQTVRPPLIQAVGPEYVRKEDDRLHAALCDAIAQGNAAEARRLVRSHLHKSLKNISRR
ncbi:MAG TPA: FadR/GntR family transcriptional regulator [Candidatus Baltobacteraceae bacterium]|nr:FadR/GntR family transcriptional regulator [Candidatus Baltobacteraceae bacterium]